MSELVMNIKMGRRDDKELSPDDVGEVLSIMGGAYEGGSAGYGNSPRGVGYAWTWDVSSAAHARDEAVDAMRKRDATIATLRQLIEGTVTALSMSDDPQMAMVSELLTLALSVPS